MINCAHPTHFDHLFSGRQGWLKRLKGIRGNASCLSHAELDESDTLNDGDPNEFGRQLHRLSQQPPSITVLGGCCGTDHRHIEAICTQLRQGVVRNQPLAKQRAESN